MHYEITYRRESGWEKGNSVLKISKMGRESKIPKNVITECIDDLPCVDPEKLLDFLTWLENFNYYIINKTAEEVSLQLSIDNWHIQVFS